MKVIGIIPARYDSTRYPGKPLVDLEGRPMIWWVYQQCLKVKGLNDVLVATDSEKIEKVCIQYGLNVMITSHEHQTGTDRLGEVAKKIEADYYINIQGDEPLIEPEVIQKVIDRCLSDDNVEIVNTITKIQNAEDVQSNTCVKVVVDANNKGLYLSRAPIPYPKKGQKIVYMKHLGLYGFSREAILFYANSKRGRIEQIEDIEMLRFIENGYEIHFIEVDSNTVAIDKPEDADRVRKILKSRSNGGRESDNGRC